MDARRREVAGGGNRVLGVPAGTGHQVERRRAGAEVGDVNRGRKGLPAAGERKRAGVPVGRERLGLEGDGLGVRSRRGRGVVRHREVSGVDGGVGKAGDRVREGLERRRRRSDGIGQRFRPALNDEPDIGFRRIVAELHNGRGNSRARPGGLDEGRLADARRARVDFGILEDRVAMIHHRGVFGGHPVGRRGGVADADFVHVALLRLRMAGERAKADAVHERLGDVPVLLAQSLLDAINVAPGNGVPHAGEVTPGVVGWKAAERRSRAPVVHPAVVQFDPHAGERIVGRRKGDETGVLVVVRLDVGLEEGDRERPDRRPRGEGRRNEEAARREGVVAELADHRAARRRRGGGVGRYCVRKREGVGLIRLVGLPAVRGGVGRIGTGAIRKELVHVPDSDVVCTRPDFRGLWD